MNRRPQSVILYASQIAACIGCNRHKKPAEVMETMWARMDLESYREALRRTGTTTEDDRINRLLEDPAIKTIVDTSSKTCAHSGDVACTYDAVSRVISNLEIPDPEDKKILEATVKKNLYTNYGTASEHHALVAIRETLGIDARPDGVFYRQRVADVDGVELWVGGKIDAITADGIVIEIKNRIRRLFYKIPFYEIVQLQTYLQLLEASRGALVECLLTQHDNAMNVVPIRRDRQLWTETIVPKMKAFVKVYSALMTSTSFQDEFLTSPKKAQLVQARINDALKAL